MSRESDTICHKCVGDEFLKARIRREGATDRCSFCDSRTKAVSVKTLSALVTEVMDEHFQPGESRPWYDEDDHAYYEQEGNDLNSMVSEIIEADEDVVNAVIEELTSLPHWEIQHGGEPRYSVDAKYIEKVISRSEIDWEWDRFRNVLRHESRFFNADARDVLDRLMGDMDTLRVMSEPEKTVIRMIEPDDSTRFYRARRADHKGELEKILKTPGEELGPPPPEIARAGRMNAEGITVFYGSLDRKTCVAELRPFIGSCAVSAEFRLQKSIRVLDFQLLEKCYHEQPLSYFQPDFRERVIYRRLLSRLHAKVRQPVLPGDELEYLTTQVLAEYLSTIVQPQIDGVLFSSAQSKEGLNVVLFAHVLDIQLDADRESIMGPNSVLALHDDSVLVHHVKAISYQFDDRAVKSGEVERRYDDEQYGELA